MLKFAIILFLFVVSSLEAKNILVLNSYRQSFRWTAQEDKGILDTLKKSNFHFTYFIEDMDTKVFRPTIKTEQNFLNYYTVKYKGIDLDAIVVTDDNALNFIQKYRNNILFKDKKVFFCGINNLNLYKTLDKTLYSGVFEKKDPLSNLKIAKKINPNLKTIYLVSDESTTAKKMISFYKLILDPIKDINFVYIDHKQTKDIVDDLKDYDKDSALFILTLGSVFKEDKKVSVISFTQELSKIYHNPILVHSSGAAKIENSNVIGGNCTDGYTQGMVTAKKLLDYMGGTNLEKIGFNLSAGNKIYINVKNLSKFGFTPDKLGFDKNNIICINNHYSFYEQYKPYIFIFVFIFILILIFMFILTLKNKQLKETADNFHHLFNNSLELNLISYQGKIIDVNEYGLKHLGYTKKEVIGRNLLEFVSSQDHELVIHNIQNRTKSGPYELQVLQSDGEYRAFLNTSIDIKKDGKVMRLSSLVDISEMKKKDKLLFEQSKLASMGEMIGNIAHQWRQPLSVITSGATAILVNKEYNMLTDDFLEYTCNTIENNAQYLSKTIDDFRNFIKGDRDKHSFYMQKAIDSFIKLIEASAKSHNIQIITNVDKTLKLDGYENELLQCYINIFNNSKDALLDKDEPKYFFIDVVTIDDKHIKVVLKDNAGGIPKDILPNIFDPYFTTKHQFHGTGLGLHMVRNFIVDGMKGQVTADNITYSYNDIQYKGARFSIILPLS